MLPYYIEEETEIVFVEEKEIEQAIYKKCIKCFVELNPGNYKDNRKYLDLVIIIIAENSCEYGCDFIFSNQSCRCDFIICLNQQWDVHLEQSCLLFIIARHSLGI